MTIQEIQNYLSDYLGENRFVALYVGIGFLFLILLLYLFVRTVFADKKPNNLEAYYDNSIDNEEVASYVERLRVVSAEGNQLSTELEQKLAAKESQVKDLEKHLEELKQQEAYLKSTIAEAGAAPVPYLSDRKLAEVKRKANRKARFLLYFGLLLGVLLTLGGVTTYYKYILKKPFWGVTINGQEL